jgi:hypothetical protein
MPYGASLDWLNFLLADVRGGFGPYVSVFLLTFVLPASFICPYAKLRERFRRALEAVFTNTFDCMLIERSTATMPISGLSRQECRCWTAGSLT